MEGVETHSCGRCLFGVAETFSRGDFFLVDCDFFLWGLGGGDVNKMSARLYSKPTKWHHLKRDSRECDKCSRTLDKRGNYIKYILQTYNIKRIFGGACPHTSNAAIPFLYSWAQWRSGAGTHLNGVPTREILRDIFLLLLLK